MKATETEPGPQACPRRLSAAEVLDLHSDLHRTTTSPHMKRLFAEYAVEEAAGFPQWQASHLHPATSLDDLDPWLASLGSDLYGATTYQVTAEMLDLAEAMQINTPDLAALIEEDLPSDHGFMWLDRPITRPSIEDSEELPPLLMHAVSWSLIGTTPVRIAVDNQATNFVSEVRAVRIREWGWNDARDIIPRPLHLMGQSTALLGHGIKSPLPELQTIHMLWILMGMKITAASRETPGRATRKRAANLASQEVRVVTLRRTRPAEAKPSATPKHIDWTCTWLVRGHYRRAPHGGTFKDGTDRTWIEPYIKGPDGLPLSSASILYKLAR